MFVQKSSEQLAMPLDLSRLFCSRQALESSLASKSSADGPLLHLTKTLCSMSNLSFNGCDWDALSDDFPQAERTTATVADKLTIFTSDDFFI
jgi:hypothetical protein